MLPSGRPISGLKMENFGLLDLENFGFNAVESRSLTQALSKKFISKSSMTQSDYSPSKELENCSNHTVFETPLLEVKRPDALGKNIIFVKLSSGSNLILRSLLIGDH